MSTQRFRTKIDGFFVVLYVLFAVRLVWPLATALLDGRPITPGLVLFPAGLLGLLYYLAASTCYVLTDTLLLVKWGPFASRIPVASIYKLRATHTILASPALSLDRIEVLARQGPYAVISPADKGGFVAALRQRVPTLELEGLQITGQPAVGPDGTAAGVRRSLARE